MTEYKVTHLGGWSRNWGDRVIQKSMSQMFKRRGIKLFQENYQGVHYQEEDAKFYNNKRDALIVGGGGAIFNRPRDESLSEWQFDPSKKFLKELKIPLIVYAIGYNKFRYDDRGWNPWDNLKLVQEKSDLFSVRSSGSKRVCVENGLEPSSIEVVPDPGLFIEPLDVEIPKLENDRLKIAICWVSDREEYFYPKDSGSSLLMDSLVHVLKSFPNTQVIQVEHIQGLDRRKRNSLQKDLSNFISIEEEMPFFYPACKEAAPYLAGIYKQVDLVIGMRGHSILIPFGQETNLLSISSHNKNKWFLEDVSCSDMHLDLDNKCSYNTSFLSQFLKEALMKSEHRKTRIRASFKEQKEKAQLFNDKVETIIKKGG